MSDVPSTNSLPASSPAAHAASHLLTPSMASVEAPAIPWGGLAFLVVLSCVALLLRVPAIRKKIFEHWQLRSTTSATRHPDPAVPSLELLATRSLGPSAQLHWVRAGRHHLLVGQHPVSGLTVLDRQLPDPSCSHPAPADDGAAQTPS